jgi:multiple sugar transport system permease protein
MRRRKFIQRVFSYVFLCLSTLIMMYPILYMVLGAFTTPRQLAETILLPIPNALNLNVIVGTWDGGLWQAYVFTLGRCLFYIALALSAGLFGGYIFSKLNFPGKNKVFLLLLSGMVMPAVLLIMPMFLMIAWFPLAGGNNLLGQGGHGLINDWRVLFIFGWVSPLAIFLFKQSFDMLPNEYQDAAKLDGAGLFTIIFRVYGPLLKPPIAALVVITFLSVWNDYLWPSLTITNIGDFMPIALRVAGTTALNFGDGGGGSNPGALMRVLLVLWPPALIYFVLQRFFVQGLVAMGLKG